MRRLAVQGNAGRRRNVERRCLSCRDAVPLLTAIRPTGGKAFSTIELTAGGGMIVGGKPAPPGAQRLPCCAMDVRITSARRRLQGLRQQHDAASSPSAICSCAATSNVIGRLVFGRPRSERVPRFLGGTRASGYLVTRRTSDFNNPNADPARSRSETDTRVPRARARPTVSRPCRAKTVKTFRSAPARVHVGSAAGP